MPVFEDYTLILPPLWTNQGEWKEALAQAAGAERDLMLAQVRAVNLLRSVPAGKATPERVAWLCLWAKVWSALEGTRGALERDAEVAISMLARSVFESSLHLQAIIEPVLVLDRLERGAGMHASVSESASEQAWQATVDRLNGYAAWCLWADRKYYEKLLNPRVLADVFDPSPTRELVADPEARKLHEALHGPLELKNEHEWRQEREQAERSWRAALHRVNAWLGHPRLTEWIARLKARDAQHQDVGFFSLLEGADVNLRGRLRALDLEFSYVHYMRGSMLIHGSTLDQFLLSGDDSIAPSIGSMRAEAERAVSDVVNPSTTMLLSLSVLPKRIWPSLSKPG